MGVTYFPMLVASFTRMSVLRYSILGCRRVDVAELHRVSSAEDGACRSVATTTSVELKMALLPKARAIEDLRDLPQCTQRISHCCKTSRVVRLDIRLKSQFSASMDEGHLRQIGTLDKESHVE